MTEDEAKAWLTARYPHRLEKLEHFVALLREESERQSLIARSTFDAIWGRHIVDSAQLVELAPSAGIWLDIGSGGGLPGLVVAIVRDAPIVLVEPRRKRAEFLSKAVGTLALPNVDVRVARIQAVMLPAAVVSARAVAPVSDILDWCRLSVSRETQLLLPRGQSWREELEITRHAWHGLFHVKQSITDTNSGIIIASDVRRQ